MWGALSTRCVGVARLRVTLTAALDQHMHWLLPAHAMAATSRRDEQRGARSGEGSFCMSAVIIVLLLDPFHSEVRGRAHSTVSVVDSTALWEMTQEMLRPCMERSSVVTLIADPKDIVPSSKVVDFVTCS